MKLSIGVGIGLFIAWSACARAGIVVNDPATGIGLGDLSAGPPLIALAGLLGDDRRSPRAGPRARSWRGSSPRRRSA